MVNEEKFSNILSEDEKIIEVYKPNKFRAVGLTLIRNAVLFLFMAAIVVVFALIPYFKDLNSSDVTCMVNGIETSGADCKQIDQIYLIIPICLASLIVVLFFSSVFTTLIKFNKTFFCYTNKRIIVRTGYFKLEYQFIDYNQISNVELKTDLLDKICKPNTGTIIFTSSEKDSSGNEKTCHFFHVEHPIENYKKIKDYFELNRSKN